MEIHVGQVTPGGDLWPKVARLFPRAVRWMNDPKDEGNYRFFAATDDGGFFLGGSVIDIGRMRFGPLSETVVGFLEDLEVLAPYRRHGVGAALLLVTLDHAWRSGCHNVRWTVDYANTAGIGLYQSMGLGFVPEEDPDTDQPEKRYTVVAINPRRVEAGYGRRPRCASDAPDRAGEEQRPREME